MNVASLLNTISSIIGAVTLPVLYCWVFLRVARRNVGNKLMECDCISGALFMACFITMKIPNYRVDYGVTWSLGPLGWIRNDFLYRQGSILGSTGQAPFAPRVKRNLFLRSAISEHQVGIYCCKILVLYRQVHRREASPSSRVFFRRGTCDRGIL